MHRKSPCTVFLHCCDILSWALVSSNQCRSTGLYGAINAGREPRSSSSTRKTGATWAELWIEWLPQRVPKNGERLYPSQSQPIRGLRSNQQPELIRASPLEQSRSRPFSAADCSTTTAGCRCPPLAQTPAPLPRVSPPVFPSSLWTSLPSLSSTAPHLLPTFPRAVHGRPPCLAVKARRWPPRWRAPAPSLPSPTSCSATRRRGR